MIRSGLEQSVPEVLQDQEVDLLTSSGEYSELVVHNDDYNTFDWVIESLMEVCKHTSEQAEQLSLIIHFKGQATVKTAPIDVLRPMKDALVDRGLNVTIEHVRERY